MFLEASQELETSTTVVPSGDVKLICKSDKNVCSTFRETLISEIGKSS